MAVYNQLLFDVIFNSNLKHSKEKTILIIQPYFSSTLLLELPETYLEPYQASKMERFAKMLNGFQLLTIFAKCTILYIRQGSEYTSEVILKYSK